MKTILSIITLSVAVLILSSHRNHERQKDTVKKEQQAETSATETSSMPSLPPASENQQVKGKASLTDFPTLHPLIVHFPIILLLLAFISQAAGLFIFKEALSWITMALAFGGVAGAYAAGELVHPHTIEILPENAAWVLEQHELYADYTLWTAIAGLVFKTVSHFIFKRKRWSEAAALILFASSAYCVSMAGHFGAQLTHIEGVGPQGKYLENGEHSQPDSH